jgi:hypothetical protein
MAEFKSRFLKGNERRFKDDADMVISAKEKLPAVTSVLSRLNEFMADPPEGIRPGFLRDRQRRIARLTAEVSNLTDDISVLDAIVPAEDQVRKVDKGERPEKKKK